MALKPMDDKEVEDVLNWFENHFGEDLKFEVRGVLHHGVPVEGLVDSLRVDARALSRLAKTLEDRGGLEGLELYA